MRISGAGSSTGCRSISRSGVLRFCAVRGGAEGPGAADDLEAWAAAARAGAGDDGGVQREAGQVEAVDDSSAGRRRVHQRRDELDATSSCAITEPLGARSARARGDALPDRGRHRDGKSAAIRQVLSQIWDRGETAIVYDPALEYLPQFYTESRGDVVLNPWTRGARSGLRATRFRTRRRR